MRVAPPSRSSKFDWNSPAAALDYELAQERALALGRLGRALEKALATLSAFDANSPAAEQDRVQRDLLTAQAGVALWNFVVQREACGLRDTGALMREYRVPREVQARMGAFPAPAAQSE